MERVLISALIFAFSPTVRDPSERISPSIFPSTTRSFENLTLPLISTSELRTLRPEVVGACVLREEEDDEAGAEGGVFCGGRWADG